MENSGPAASVLPLFVSKFTLMHSMAQCLWTHTQKCNHTQHSRHIHRYHRSSYCDRISSASRNLKWLYSPAMTSPPRNSSNLPGKKLLCVDILKKIVLRSTACVRELLACSNTPWLKWKKLMKTHAYYVIINIIMSWPIATLCTDQHRNNYPDHTFTIPLCVTLGVCFTARAGTSSWTPTTFCSDTLSSYWAGLTTTQAAADWSNEAAAPTCRPSAWKATTWRWAPTRRSSTTWQCRRRWVRVPANSRGGSLWSSPGTNCVSCAINWCCVFVCDLVEAQSSQTTTTTTAALRFTVYCFQATNNPTK